MALPALPNKITSLFRGSTQPTPGYTEDGPYVMCLTGPPPASTFMFFHGTEIPERLSSLGGNMVLAVHNFPGGIRTVQELGFFPAAIEFSGWLFSNPGHQVFGGNGADTAPITALGRYQQLKQLCNAGGPFTLSYGGITLQGNIEKCENEVYNQFRLRYTIKMVVTADLSNINNSVEEQNQLQQLQKWSKKMTNLIAQPNMPFQIGNPMALLQTATQSILLKGNSAAAADFANLTSLASNLSGAIGPFLGSGTTPEIQSLALDSNTVANGVSATAVSAIAPAVQSLPTINPNLFSLSQTYMGDFTQFTTLMQANNLSDPQPIGSFNISIPPVPPVSTGP